MKTRVKLLLIVGLLALVQTYIYSQDTRPTSYVGINVGGGFSHLFFGSPFASDAIATPQLGGGASVGMYYEMKYKHLLIQTGFGVNYSINQNIFHIDALSANIEEYPTMTYHYTLDNYRETTTYGIGYIPLKIGASFKQWYFLAGANIGLLSFGGRTTVSSDVTTWASDQDIIDPIQGMPNHGLYSYQLDATSYPVDFAPFNAMLTAEIGVVLNKSAWVAQPKVKMDKAAKYREARRKKTLKELTQFRLSIFADYGLSNIHAYQSNPVSYGGQNQGGLVAINSVTDLTPHSVLGYEPFKQTALNNLFVGVKLSVQFEIPKKAPKKGSLATPYVYVYVKDEVTDKALPNARVKIQKEGSTRKPYEKYTDTKYGRVGKAYAPGRYWTHVSHSSYSPVDTIHFVHRDDFDTLRVALYPLHKICWPVEDAISNEGLAAQVQIYKADGTLVLKTQTDSLNSVCALLDDRVVYTVKAQSEGYEDYEEEMDVKQEETTIHMIPVPKRTFILQNMHFATAQTTILPSSQNALNMLYELLRENPDMYIRIVGHTDDVGKDHDNQILSEGRSMSIFDEMVKRGIDPKRIQTAGRGESEPVVPNTSDENRQKNRRVEIEIISGDEGVNINRLEQTVF
jgi:outer membrane protein OmpA-like peptidoglycan-associated protein